MWDHAGHEVEYWQRRAAESRAMTADITSEGSRRLMASVIECYDRLAARAATERLLAGEIANDETVRNLHKHADELDREAGKLENKISPAESLSPTRLG